MIRAEHKYMLLLARADGLDFGLEAHHQST